MNKFMTICMGILAIALSACDAHKEFPDTSTKVCNVLCSDGKIVSIEDFEAKNKKAVAVVFDINRGEETDGDGLAVFLHELEPTAFADSLGVNQGTNTTLSSMEGNTNTFSMYNCRDVTSSLANEVFDLWEYGQSAYIPSVAQMRKLYAAKDAINPIIKKLGGDVIPDNPENCWYWTSTEVAGQETAKSWLYSLSSGAIQETPKTQAHKARAIITLYQ